MENHPIPQDITGFQFKLIGSMTVKQFLYLAAGVIVAWFIFSSQLFFLIKWPLVLLFGGGGALLAFVPIGGRPMDVMIGHFIKAFFRDSAYVYDKAGGNLTQVPANPVLSPAPETHPALSAKQPSSIPIQAHEMPQHQTAPPPVAQAPVIQMSTPVISPASKEPLPQPVGHHTEAVLEKAKTPEPALTKPVDLPQEQPQKLTPAPTAPALSSATVRQVPASQTRSVGIPATPEAPNLVTGIIKDPRGNPLPNILVEIKDKEGNPVRAFKTNGLGHFASATPLLDGSYVVEFEDIKAENKFQKISFEARGQVIMPFEIISTDKREELRKELFQN